GVAPAPLPIEGPIMICDAAGSTPGSTVVTSVCVGVPASSPLWLPPLLARSGAIDGIFMSVTPSGAAMSVDSPPSPPPPLSFLALLAPHAGTIESNPAIRICRCICTPPSVRGANDTHRRLDVNQTLREHTATNTGRIPRTKDVKVALASRHSTL